MEDKEAQKKAEELVERHITYSKLMNENDELIEKEVLSIKEKLRSTLLPKVKEWYVDRYTDIPTLDKIISEIDFGLSEKSSIKLKGVDKVNGLTGKKVTSVEIDYKLTFTDELSYKLRDELLLENIKVNSKFRKIL